MDFSANAGPYRAGVAQVAAANRSVRSGFVGLATVADRFNASLTSSVIATAAYAAGVNALRTVLGGTTAAFLRFDTQLIAVQKTAGLTQNETDRLGRAIRDLTTVASSLGGPLPIAREELARIAVVAGQMNIRGVPSILRFTETVGLLGVTTDLAGDQAANAIGKILETTTAGVDEVDRLGSALTALGNAFRGGEADILEQANFIATQTASFRQPAQDILAYSAALAAGGQRPESSGTQFQRLFQSLTDAAEEAQVGNITRLAAIVGRAGLPFEELTERVNRLREAIQSGDFRTATLTFLEALRDAGPRAGQIQTALFGGTLPPARAARVFGFLSENLDELSRALGVSTGAWEENSATIEEATLFAEGLGGRYITVGQQITEQGLRIGERVGTAFIEVAEEFRAFELVGAGLATGLFTGAVQRRVQNFNVTSRALRNESQQAARALRTQGREITNLSERIRDSRNDRLSYLRSVREERDLRVNLARLQEQQLFGTAVSRAQARRDPNLLRYGARLRLVNEEIARTTARLREIEQQRSAGVITTAAQNDRARRQEIRARERLQRLQQDQNRLQRIANRNNSIGARIARGLGGAFAFMGGTIGLVAASLVVTTLAFALFTRRLESTSSAVQAVTEDTERFLEGQRQAGLSSGEILIQRNLEAQNRLFQERGELVQELANVTGFEQNVDNRIVYRGVIPEGTFSPRAALIRDELREIDAQIEQTQDNLDSLYGNEGGARGGRQGAEFPPPSPLRLVNTDLLTAGRSTAAVSQALSDSLDALNRAEELTTRNLGRSPIERIRANLIAEQVSRIEQEERARERSLAIAREDVRVGEEAVRLANDELDRQRGINAAADEVNQAQAQVNESERRLALARLRVPAAEEELELARATLMVDLDRVDAAARRRRTNELRTVAEGPVTDVFADPQRERLAVEQRLADLSRGVELRQEQAVQERRLQGLSDRSAAGERERLRIAEAYNAEISDAESRLSRAVGARDAAESSLLAARRQALTAPDAAQDALAVRIQTLRQEIENLDAEAENAQSALAILLGLEDAFGRLGDRAGANARENFVGPLDTPDPIVFPDPDAERRAAQAGVAELEQRLVVQREAVRQQRELEGVSAQTAAGLQARFEVENAYLDAQLQAQARINAARQEAADLQRELDAGRTRLRAGDVPEAERMALEDHLASIRSRIAEVNAESENAQAAAREVAALEAAYGDLAFQFEYLAELAARGPLDELAANSIDLRAGFQGLGEDARRLNDVYQNVAAQGIQRLEDSLVQMFRTGRFEGEALAQFLLGTLIQALIQTTISANLARAALAFGDFLFGPSAGPPGSPLERSGPVPQSHSGGVVGAASQFRYLRHGLASNERLTILETGEEVLTARDPRHRRNVHRHTARELQSFLSTLPRYHEGGVVGGRRSGGAPGGEHGVQLNFEFQLINRSRADLGETNVELGEAQFDGLRFVQTAVLADLRGRGPIARGVENVARRTR